MTTRFAQPLIEICRIVSHVEHGDGWRYRLKTTKTYAITLWWCPDDLPPPVRTFRRGTVYVSNGRWSERDLARHWRRYWKRQFAIGLPATQRDFTACGPAQDALR